MEPFRKYIPVISILFLISCIKNDLPYPYIEGKILDVEVEGQTRIEISNTNTVTIEVNDSVDIRKLRINKMLITEEATVDPNEKSCIDYINFPKNGFASLEELPYSANTKVDFRSPFSLVLETYQSYPWKIIVNQPIGRTVEMSGQVGEPFVDELNKTIIVYVSKDHLLNNITVNKLKLGLAESVIRPDFASVTDFSRSKEFTVYNYPNDPEPEGETWTIAVLHTETVVQTKSASAWAKKAYLTGEAQTGTDETPTFAYRMEGESNWTTVPSSQINIQGGTFTTEITGLQAGRRYLYKAVLGSSSGDEKSFTTETEQPIANLNFDDWYKDGKTWYPNKNLTTDYLWDSGNKGTNTLGEKNPTSPETTDVVKGTAARLASTSVMGVFAAGSIYTGYFSKVVGLGAELMFGRPYTVRPTEMSGYYKYTSGIIDKSKDPYKSLQGTQDSCHIYIALFKWDNPFLVSTADNKFIDMTPKNPNLIGFGEFKSPESTTAYKKITIPVTYYDKTTQPTHILIVGSASKYGDYFTGSSSSVLFMDEFELGFD